jgi:hypothetical protein
MRSGSVGWPRQRGWTGYYVASCSEGNSGSSVKVRTMDCEQHRQRDLDPSSRAKALAPPPDGRNKLIPLISPGVMPLGSQQTLRPGPKVDRTSSSSR